MAENCRFFRFVLLLSKISTSRTGERKENIPGHGRWGSLFRPYSWYLARERNVKEYGNMKTRFQLDSTGAASRQ